MRDFQAFVRDHLSGLALPPARELKIVEELAAQIEESYDALIAEGIAPIRRWGEPADIGRAAVALASGAFAFSVGEAIRVDGGLALRRL